MTNHYVYENQGDDLNWEEEFVHRDLKTVNVLLADSWMGNVFEDYPDRSLLTSVSKFHIMERFKISPYVRRLRYSRVYGAGMASLTFLLAVPNTFRNADLSIRRYHGRVCGCSTTVSCSQGLMCGKSEWLYDVACAV